MSIRSAFAVTALLAALPGAAWADVKNGVEAWNKGDYDTAIKEWRPRAVAGDPEAQFNMGQAYKLGRGVPVDLSIAIEWYRKAAAQGNLRAEDNYGLLLFQSGKRQEAIPSIEKAAARGEPRAQYILATSLFNGEFIEKDWVRAYALMTRAAASGLPQAATSLAQMDGYMPLAQRQQGTELAAKLEGQEQSNQNAQATIGAKAPIASPAAVKPPVSAKPAPIRKADLPPSSVSEPAPVKVATVGPTWTNDAPPAKPVTKPTPKPAAKPAPAPTTAATPVSGAGSWRIQFGAFSQEGRARDLWDQLVRKVSALDAYQPYLVKSENVTRLQAGPFTNGTDANALCGKVKSVTGADCIVKKM